MKPRTGLGKKVSSIFDGVPVPGAKRDSTADERDAGDGTLMRDGGVGPGAAADKYAKPASMRTRYGDISVRVQQQLFGPSSGTDQRRQKIAMAMVVVLFIILVLAIYYNYIAPANNPAAKPAPVPAPAVVAEPAAVTVSWKEPAVYPDNLRDPMLMASAVSIVQKGAPAEKPISLALRGIVFSADKPSIIVNGQIVYQGQTVEGVTVQKISKHSVEFKYKDKTWTQVIEK